MIGTLFLIDVCSNISLLHKTVSDAERHPHQVEHLIATASPPISGLQPSICPMLTVSTDISGSKIVTSLGHRLQL
ncbi:hypothetical protein MRB53_019085 [Persea americana]|uniref:Uncharacterized protein n=1 Tax=Persea americana TaxID=3435 RepID=A0ACC2M9T4_PERAE|nr:hypothetical protein MRB53_019085 [Persea americana]